MSRPPIPPEDRRIKMWPWVSQETKAAIEEHSKSEQVSNGAIIDRAVAAYDGPPVYVSKEELRKAQHEQNMAMRSFVDNAEFNDKAIKLYKGEKV